MKGQTFVPLLGGAVLLVLTSLIAAQSILLRSSSGRLIRPPLVQGLPADFAEADAAFEVRIAEAFPPSTSEAVLIQRLQAEGFVRPPANPAEAGRGEEHRARFTQPVSACVLTWRVRWRAEAGRLVSAGGDDGGTCL